MVTALPRYREEALREIRTTRVGPDASHTDYELMLRAWHSGPAGRDVALEMADLDRTRAAGTRPVGAKLSEEHK